MALDKITSDSLATGAVNVSALPDGVISAAKLHTTAIQDKLGYTPVSTNNPTFTGTITFTGDSSQQVVFDRTMGDNWIGSSVVIENGNISIFEPPTGFLNWLNSLAPGDIFTIQPGGQEITVASTGYSPDIFLITPMNTIDETPGQGLETSFWITSFTQGDVTPPDIFIGLTPLGSLATKNTVGPNDYVNSSITSAKLVNGAVTSEKISDGAVTTAKINDGSVTTAKINDGAINAAKLASATITTAKISDGAITAAKLSGNALFLTQFNVRTSQHSLGGDSGWVDHLSMTFTTNRVCNCLFIYSSSSSYESGTVQGFARLILDGTQIGYNSAVAKQSASNSAGSGTCIWDKQNVSAGSHTITVQIRNTQGGSTWITPYWTADSNTGNTIGVLYYGG